MSSNRVSSFLGDLYPKCTDAFSRHDKEGTGKIATKDVGPIITEIFGRNLPEDQLQKQVNRLKGLRYLHTYHVEVQICF